MGQSVWLLNHYWDPDYDAEWGGLEQSVWGMLSEGPSRELELQGQAIRQLLEDGVDDREIGRIFRDVGIYLDFRGGEGLPTNRQVLAWVLAQIEVELHRRRAGRHGEPLPPIERPVLRPWRRGSLERRDGNPVQGQWIEPLLTHGGVVVEEVRLTWRHHVDIYELDHPVLILVLSGRVNLEIRRQPVVLWPDQYVVIPTGTPWYIHHTEAAEGSHVTRYLAIHLPPEDPPPPGAPIPLGPGAVAALRAAADGGQDG